MEKYKLEVETLLEHHRFYSNRHWQYFGAILLINSLLFTVIKDLAEYIMVISYPSVLIITIFYHLINWTDMRIESNMKRINNLLDKPIYEPDTLLENTINWSKAGVIIITFPYFYFLKDNVCLLSLLMILFISIIILSEWTRKNFEQKHKDK